MIRRIYAAALLLFTAQMLVCSADGINEAKAGRNALLAGDYEVAIRLFSRALNGELSGDDRAAVLNLRGLAFYDNGDLDKSVLDFDGAIRLQPNNVIAHCDRGHAFVKMGLFEKIKGVGVIYSAMINTR